jgi:hypothetical protein
MLGRFAARKMIAVRSTTLAARIGIRRLVALALGTAIRCLAIELPACKAVEGPREQEDRHESNRDMQAAPHFQIQHNRCFGGQSVVVISIMFRSCQKAGYGYSRQMIVASPISTSSAAFIRSRPAICDSAALKRARC